MNQSLKCVSLVMVAIIALTAIATCSGCSPVDTEECRDAIASAEEAARSEEAGKWREALEEANDTIERLNSEIEDAKAYTGASYDDMVLALMDLDLGETVDEP